MTRVILRILYYEIVRDGPSCCAIDDGSEGMVVSLVAGSAARDLVIASLTLLTPADDNLDNISQTGHAFSRGPDGRGVAVRKESRQDCDETRRVPAPVELLIRPVSFDRTGIAAEHADKSSKKASKSQSR